MFGFFELDIKKLLLVLLILALPLISLNLEHRDADSIHWYDLPLLYVINPTQEFFTHFALGISDTTSQYVNLIGIKKDNRVLRDQVAQLKQELKLKEEVVAENDRLKQLLDFKKESSDRLIPAQVTGSGLWSDYSSVTINKGSNSGVRKKMGVIDRQGVVGYVINVMPDYSNVIILTDKNSVIDSVVQKNRARGIIEGRGRDLCQMKYLLRTDDVGPGDVVVTSGMDDIFPRGFPVGTVTRVAKKLFGVTQYVEVRPVVDVTRIEEVLVVAKTDNKKDQDEQDNTNQH